MKIIRLLWLYKLITIISSISTNDELTCRNINNNTTRICKKKNILISVEELYPSPYLFIIDKKITSIAPNAFKNLTIFHLTFILCNDKLNIEIDSWNGLPMLKSLEIKSGIIPMIPGLFKSLDETLNKLTLIINRDDQSLITTTLKGLKNLLHLKIIKSNLTIISSDMLKFYPIVVDIEFADDNITSIELQAFSSFKSLKHLRLSSNKLKNIQPDNNLLDNLIPGVFKGLDELSLLSMTSNNIKKIKIGIFNELKNLTSLNLVGNNIDDIEPGSFEGLDLDCLELDNNNLTIIKSDTFRGLTSRIISLSKNNNLVIEDNAFRNSTIMILFLENTNVVVNKEAWDLSESTWINV
ncbi:leucine-rich repeat-containing protein 15-like [Aphidius gifuensis]|uniref:leucine-rich repeat-containing protein 15-like n=1 Tax=Aphidius gifuensis TaxID=684658 RepID=UPI001CDC2C73|nr:leucine-rich repeat-containing protein 15-like [Aphidius gifuensis]